MAQTSSMRGEKIYEVDLDIVGVTDFGISLQAIHAGEQKIPPQGARFDVAFSGHAKGRLEGRVHGVVYLILRADGRLDLDIRATIETPDGQRIAGTIDGQCVPRAGEPIHDLFENVQLTTASKDYAWVNGQPIWAVGTVNLATGKILIEAYMQ